MRIIAGQFRGRTLLGPEGSTTRPVTDRVKQSIFDFLGDLTDGAVAYDCFAGTGSMGLEVLSRGGKFAKFFEADRSALSRLRQNIAALKINDQCTVIATDIFKWAVAAPPPESDQRANLLFLDPPYRYLNERADELRQLTTTLARNHLAPNAFIVFRHDDNDELDLTQGQDLSGLSIRRYDSRTYGGMRVEFLTLAVD